MHVVYMDAACEICTQGCTGVNFYFPVASFPGYPSILNVFQEKWEVSCLEMRLDFLFLQVSKALPHKSYSVSYNMFQHPYDYFHNFILASEPNKKPKIPSNNKSNKKKVTTDNDDSATMSKDTDSLPITTDSKVEKPSCITESEENRNESAVSMEVVTKELTARNEDTNTKIVEKSEDCEDKSEGATTVTIEQQADHNVVEQET